MTSTAESSSSTDAADNVSWSQTLSGALSWLSGNSVQRDQADSRELKLDFGVGNADSKSHSNDSYSTKQSGGGPAGNREADLAEQARKEAEAERQRRSRQLKQQHNVQALPNPGKVDELGRDIQDILSPTLFEGVRVDYHKPVSAGRDKNFTYGHMIWMGSDVLPENGHYEFSTHLGLDKSVLISQLGVDGTLSGRIHHQFTPELLMKCSFTLPPSSKRQLNNGVLEVDWSSGDSSLGAKITSDKVMVASYFQSISASSALGVEAVYSGAHNILQTRYVGRWQSGLVAAGGGAGGAAKDTLIGSIMENGSGSLSYAYRVSDRVTLASELRFDSSTHESNWLAGYRWQLRSSQFKGTVDSDGTVAASLEEMIAPVVKLTLNGQLSHATHQYKFGIGATIG